MSTRKFISKWKHVEKAEVDITGVIRWSVESEGSHLQYGSQYANARLNEVVRILGEMALLLTDGQQIALAEKLHHVAAVVEPFSEQH